MRITLEIQYKGKTYKTPDARIKTGEDGTVQYLIRDGKWKTIKGKDVRVVKWSDEFLDDDIILCPIHNPLTAEEMIKRGGCYASIWEKSKQEVKDDISKHVEIGMSTAEIFKKALEESQCLH